jgi:transcriptional regulator with GAF, ATPase, and Fis domain
LRAQDAPPPAAEADDASRVLGDIEGWLLAAYSDDQPDDASGLDDPLELTDLTPSGASVDGLLGRTTNEPDSPVPVSARLAKVLAGATLGLGCNASALYELDDATTELSMRSMVGLSAVRLMDDPRPLRGAIADLEAMCGAAVVLEDDTMNAYWRVPEPCGAAVCVPVATASMVLGTLWFFCDAPREFDDNATNLMEIVAGRLALELEIESLRESRRASVWSSPDSP